MLYVVQMITIELKNMFFAMPTISQAQIFHSCSCPSCQPLPPPSLSQFSKNFKIIIVGKNCEMR